MSRDSVLTVLLLTYNHEDSIAKAIESIMEQETEYLFELWILEDCSTDNTLGICRRYQKRHPDKIKVVAQPVNTKAEHVLEARQKVKTDYFTILEGDDWWCDKNKIQIALDTLNKYPKYVTFAHDTLYNDLVNKTQQSLVHDIHKIVIKNPVTLEGAPYLHTSSRIHRNVIDFNEQPIIGDIYLYYAFLDKGPLYYYDKIMSVYNINGSGVWSKLSSAEQRRRMDVAQLKTNSMLNFKYDPVFSQRVGHPYRLGVIKKIFGTKLGWRLYILGLKYNHEKGTE